MALWPTLAEVKTVLGVNTDARDGVLTAATAAAIEHVLIDIGYRDVVVVYLSDVFSASVVHPDDSDESGDESGSGLYTPSYSVSQAALILAVAVAKAPDAPYGIAAVFDAGALRVAAENPAYQQMLLGKHVAFGVG